MNGLHHGKQRKDGFLQGGNWLISWCYGHLVEFAPADAYGEQYKRWSYNTLPILPDEWKYRTSEGKKKQLDILRSLMNRSDVDSIVCATDAGREGELEDTATLPELAEGLTYRSVTAAIKESKTSPPKRYTEDIQYKGWKRKPPNILWQRLIRSGLKRHSHKGAIDGQIRQYRALHMDFIKPGNGVQRRKLPPFPPATLESGTG